MNGATDLPVLFDLYDRKGIPVSIGDIVKVFHFTDHRNKKHYMYKQIDGIKMIGPNKSSMYVSISHLNMGKDENYIERPDGRIMRDWEIVQSMKCDHQDREKKNAN